MNIKNVHIKITLLTLLVLLITISQPVSGQAAWTSSGPPGGGYVNSISFSLSDEGIVYADTISGVYKSTDGGGTWSFLGLRGIDVNTVKVDTEDAQLVYAVADIEIGLFKSLDGGEDWIQLAVDEVLTMDIDPNDPEVIWVVADSAIFKSSDQGDTWIEMHDDIHVNSIIVDPENFLNIFASGSGGFVKSMDGGETWEKQSNPSGPSSEYLENLVVTPRGHIPQRLYAISKGDVYMSTDKGETWTALGVSDFGKSALGSRGIDALTIYVDPTRPDLIVIGTSDRDYPLIGRYNSENIWVWGISNNQPERAPTCMAVNPFEPEKILAGYNDGILFINRHTKL